MNKVSIILKSTFVTLVYAFLSSVCVAAEYYVATAEDQVARGSVIEITASEVDSSLSEFTKKPKLYATCGNRNVKLKIVSSLPSKTVNAEWTKKLLLYKKRDYRGTLLSEQLKNNPIEKLEINGLYITVKEKSPGTEVYNKKLNKTITLETPVISSITGNTSKRGDPFKVIGEYFGSKLPEIFVEYLKNGDKESPKYKKCKIDKKASLQFKDAKGKDKKSCMVVLACDVSSTTATGYSEVSVKYPKLKDSDQATGYIIMDNGIGLAAYDTGESASSATLTMIVSPANGGTTSPIVGTSTVSTGQTQSISATAMANYTFSNWSATTNATIADATSATTTLTLSGNATVTANFSDASGSHPDMIINNVKTWAYNIQDVNTDAQRKELVGTHFDMYVLEPVVTDKNNPDFDIKGLISDIRKYNQDNYDKNPLILAYVDVGQAEDWRWYWQSDWKIGNPEWLVGDDPNNWEGNYPVAYWHQTWENIVIYGYEGTSHVDEILKAGFDGIYMDWVEAFSDNNVVSKAAADGVAPASAMFDFIEKIREYARTDSPNANPDFLVIAQNAPDLYGKDTARYEALIDAIALEAIWYDGTGGFDNWNGAKAYNIWTNDLYPDWIEEVLAMLEPLKGKMPVFCCEYAQDLDGNNFATKVYTELAPANNFIPYCTRRSLA